MGPKNQALKWGSWQLSMEHHDRSDHLDLSLLWSHTTDHSNTRTAQLEMTTFSGLNFLKLEQSHGTWVNSSSDQSSAQFSSHYQVIRSFVNLSKPLPALKFWNLILEKWETTSCEAIWSNRHSESPILFLVHQNCGKVKDISCANRKYFPEVKWVSWFPFSIMLTDKGNSYRRISMPLKKLTKLEMFQKNNSLSGSPRKWCPYCEYEVFTYD